MTNTGAPATVSFPSATDFVVTREFRASPDELFAAFTAPQAIRRWWGPRGTELGECTVDLRVGGSWRFVQMADDGEEHAFSGEYREIDPPRRLVWTERYERFDDSEHVVTVELTEQGATTLLHLRAVFPGQVQRDQWVGAGMEKGMNESYERLDQYLARSA